MSGVKERVYRTYELFSAKKVLTIFLLVLWQDRHKQSGTTLLGTGRRNGEQKDKSQEL